MLTPQLTASRRAPPVRGAPTELGFRKASSRALGIGIPPAHVRLTRAPRRQRPGLQLIDDRSDPPLVYPRVPPVPRPQLLLDLVLAPTPVEIFWFSLHLAPTPPRPRVQKRRRRSSLSLSPSSRVRVSISAKQGDLPIVRLRRPSLIHPLARARRWCRGTASSSSLSLRIMGAAGF